MAERKPQIVIKKITVVSGGAHGGAWKVAFADFMTAMMAFFLVMWLLATQTEQTKKAVSDYFSTPSVIEYQFHNFGVELTLEKLFLDLINEPLKVFQAFLTPVDRTPNVMAMGMKKVVMSYMADQLGSIAQDVEVTGDTLDFEIPDQFLFELGSSRPSVQFNDIMEKVRGVTAGLEDADLIISSIVYDESVPGRNHQSARVVANQRLDVIEKQVKASLEHESVDIKGFYQAKRDDRPPKANRASGGIIKFEFKQKKVLSDGTNPRKLSDGLFGDGDGDGSVYDQFVEQVSKRRKKE